MLKRFIDGLLWKYRHRPIYTITTYRREATLRMGNMLVHDRRTVGWHHDLQDALQAVANNYGDLEEAGYYKWAVVEEYPCGLYGIGSKMQPIWFEYVGNDFWERIDVSPNRCPQEMKDAMGGFDRMIHWATIG